LVTARPTLDLDSSDVEVFGRKKRGAAYTYEGKKAGRPLLASWARTGLVLAADLLVGVPAVAWTSCLLAIVRPVNEGRRRRV